LAIPEAEKEIELTLTLPEKVEITALLEMVGKLLGLNYIYDEKLIKGDIMLKIHGGTVKVKNAYALLEQALKFKGFVMTRRGRLVTIVPQAQALDYDPTLRTSPQDIQPGDVIVTSIFRLKHVDTASAEALLKSMKLGTIINAIPETGTLIVTGYAYRMGRIEKLLKMIDVRGKPRKFQSRQLQHTAVTDVLPKIQTLADQLGTVSVSISVSKTAAAATPAKKPQTAAERRAAQRRPQTPAKSTTTTKKGGAVAKQAVYLDADERTNRILMIGLAEDIDLVNELIDALDVEKPDLRVIKEYEIQHVDPTQIIDTLGELGVITATSRRSTTQRRTTPTTSKSPAAGTARRTTPTSTSRGGSSAPGEEEEPQISVLPATNSLLINALPAQHAMIALVIAHVDRELDETTLPYVVYPLENQDPQELADVLSKLIEKTVKAKAAVAAKDAKVQTRPTAASTSTSKLQDEITIVADAKTYSLVVYASKKNQQWIGTLIKNLDEYRPQVLLDVTLVEITKTDDFNYDLGIISSIPDLTNTSGLTSTILNNTGDAIFTSSDILEKLLEEPRDRRRFIDMQADSGKFTGFYGDKKVQALLTAMQTKRYGRILAKPKILVDDNQEGNIETKTTTYIERTTTNIQQTQSGDPITTEDQKFEPYDASIQLGIKPHISKGENLRLEITLMRSDFVDFDKNSLKPPNKAATDVKTVVTVPDGSTIILGGMEKVNQAKGGDKVPILGDIPLIGGLFRSTSNTSAQSKLYIFIKAHILRPGTNLTSEDLIVISRRNRADFEETETEMQEYEDWPGIKPKPMEPLQILEVDEIIVP
jgi:type II secretory pathway component GspD/PulD (secretin)